MDRDSIDQYNRLTRNGDEKVIVESIAEPFIGNPSKAMTEHTCELTSDDVPEDVCGAPATKKVVTRYGTIWACDDHYQRCGYDPDFFET